MKLLRRQFLYLAAGAAALQVVSRIAWGESYPSRPLRLIIGYPPGGSADITARLTGQWLSERVGQPVVIPASSTWRPPATGRRSICRASCLRC
jgi:tripartite-type tricarboxylate transporter receptor subunit TctC